MGYRQQLYTYAKKATIVYIINIDKALDAFLTEDLVGDIIIFHFEQSGT